MEEVERTGLPDRLPITELQKAFDQKPVRLAICFGSYVSGETHATSDIDIAVEFEKLEPGDSGYNDVFFEVYEAVSQALGTDTVDLLDIHSLSNSLARSVLTNGVLVYGDIDRVEPLQEQRLSETNERSPRDRLDHAIERIDSHLA
jgi:predicted nucleotidyltransferase